ncbi:MAG TPA: hypothetical protein VFW05_06865 [Verrucomicrobiae bacterium]|nr:hypothetical protein [Verrucomicrobiae bacterium]
MRRILSHVLVIVAVLAATGSHWLLLQSVAWTGMLANNLQTQSFSEAVDRTFSGAYPCSLCKQISKAKNAEKKTEFTVQSLRLEWVWDFQPIVLNAPTDFRLIPMTCEALRNLRQSPPVPPPRSFTA